MGLFSSIGNFAVNPLGTLGGNLGGTRDALFGGAGGSQSQTGIAGVQLPFLQELFGEASGLFGSGQLGRLAGFNPLQMEAHQMGAETARGLQPQVQGMQQALGSLLSGDVNLDPYQAVASGVADQMGQTFREDIIPGIRRGSLLSSGRATSRPGIASQKAADAFQRDLGSTLNQLFLPAFTQAQDLRGQALGMVPGLFGASMMPANFLGGIGAQQQAQQQAQMQQPFTAAQQFSSLLGSPIMQSSSSGTTASPGIFAPIQLGR